MHGRRTLAYAALLFMASSGLPPSVFAGEDPTTVEGQSQIEPAEGVNTGRNTVVVPIPVSNPTVGTGLALAGMILYKVDPASPDSSTTLGGGYLSSESWLVGGAQKLNFDADRYRLNAMLGLGQINYDFFGIGSSATSQGIPLRQKVFGGTFDFRREIIEGLHVGARWVYANVKTAVGVSTASLPPELQGKELDLTVSGMGLVASWDTRDRRYHPPGAPSLNSRAISQARSSAAILIIRPTVSPGTPTTRSMPPMSWRRASTCVRSPNPRRSSIPAHSAPAMTCAALRPAATAT